MAKYRTKPFEIEAVLFTGDNFDEILDFVGYRYPDKYPVPNFAVAGEYRFWEDSSIVAEVYDHLHSTWVGVKAGQYIIKGSKGEFYPCDPDVFHAKYESYDAESETEQIVNLVLNSNIDPERVASEVINRLRRRRRGNA